MRTPRVARRFELTFIVIFILIVTTSATLIGPAPYQIIFSQDMVGSENMADDGGNMTSGMETLNSLGVIPFLNKSNTTGQYSINSSG